MSQSRLPKDERAILQDAWDHVVGGLEWLSSVFYGEFADHRPLSAVVVDMLISFVPGVVILTSARDAVAVVLRLANHPEKREDLMEWVLLSACLIVIALPLAMAAGAAVAAGVGAVVGGIAGSELGAALRAVMLMLIKEASKLVELVRFLQKFMKGDVLKFLRAVKFAKYEKALIQALSKIIGKLIEIVKALRTHLENLKYFDTVKTTIAKLASWEKKFYDVQQDSLKQIPKALAELDARLGNVLAQSAPKEAHTVTAGILSDKASTALPTKQRIRDTPGRALPNAEDETREASTIKENKKNRKSSKNQKIKNISEPTSQDKPELIQQNEQGTNTKKQTVADAAVAAERDQITQLSNEARNAEKYGNKELAATKLEEARDILRPYLPEKPNENWDEVIARLDVSSPKDGAVFWSGDPKAAQKFSEGINGVTLETTAGGSILDGWDEINKGYTWDERFGDGPYARDLWKGVSEKYAEGAMGQINTVQTPEKLWDEGTLWHNNEKTIVRDKLQSGEATGISMHTINNSGEFIPLSDNYINSLLQLQGRISK